jgi:pimeloyl-ACP methyl ester carboxylesterase
MAHALNGGTRIHYQVLGEGPPLILQHGLTQSMEDWMECGYAEDLALSRQLILVDARGHGGSDRPRDEAAYALEQRVGDVLAVLDAVGVERADFWGYSMGGFIGFGMALRAPDRLARLVIGGSHPFARDPEINRCWLRAALPGGGALVRAIQAIGGPIPAGYRSRLAQADVEALIASVPAGAGMEDMLPGMTTPCLIYAGDADPLFEPARDGAARIPGSTFVALPGLGHLAAFIDSAVVLAVVKPFLERRQ